MTAHPDISVVIPARDEIIALGPLVEEIAQALAGRAFEAIVVDDGSTDGTPHALAALQARPGWRGVAVGRFLPDAVTPVCSPDWLARAGALVLLAVAARGHVISTRKVLHGAPWQIVVFSLGMYLVVYGLRNAGLTDFLAGVLNRLAAGGLWTATIGTGFVMAFISSVMNNMPSVLIGNIAIADSAALVAEAAGTDRSVVLALPRGGAGDSRLPSALAARDAAPWLAPASFSTASRPADGGR